MREACDIGGVACGGLKNVPGRGDDTSGLGDDGLSDEGGFIASVDGGGVEEWPYSRRAFTCHPGFIWLGMG